MSGNLATRSVDVTLDAPGQAAFCLFVNTLSNACPVYPPAGTVGTELTDLIGTGMGSPSHQRLVAKIMVYGADDLTDLYGQMAAKEYNGIRFVRFISPIGRMSRSSPPPTSAKRPPSPGGAPIWTRGNVTGTSVWSKDAGS